VTQDTLFRRREVSLEPHDLSVHFAWLLHHDCLEVDDQAIIACHSFEAFVERTKIREERAFLGELILTPLANFALTGVVPSARSRKSDAHAAQVRTALGSMAEDHLWILRLQASMLFAVDRWPNPETEKPVQWCEPGFLERSRDER
jgi:hypothetical protein